MVEKKENNNKPSIRDHLAANDERHVENIPAGFFFFLNPRNNSFDLVLVVLGMWL